ncbi:Zinc finger, C2H2 type [Popillia japonica]|uniref:Zinc finger protein 865 n=1 Tax=Popillia japonica TaxID=7064 RepID=A0AAW1KMZ1_POPJA
MSDVCRLCLSEIPEINKLNYDYYTSYESQLKLIIPEIDVATTTTFVLCEQCLESLNRSYSFKCKCLETEKLIANYLGEINATVINLKHLKTQRYKDDVSSVESSIEIKEICDNYEDFNISGIQTFVDVEAICTGTNETDNEDQTQPELNNDSDKASTTITEKQISSQPFTCDICNKIFTHRHQLTRHQLTHKKKEFICDICKKGFTTQYDLKRHAKTHIKTRELNKCPTCLKLVQDVSRHIQSCHQHKHVCDICGAKFGFNSNLIDHKRTHTGDRPYRCEMCGKGFAQTSTLYLHIRSIHTNERPHICQTCGKGFTKPAEVRRHELVHIPNREKKLCLSDIPEIRNKLSHDDYTSYDTKIKLLMPEIDTATTTTFVLCELCSESLNSAYNFKRRCLEVEKLIFNYMKETNATVINLKRLKDQSLNESPSFCDVNVICDKSNDNFYDEDINNSNEDLLTQEQPEIEIHETKLFCEPIRKPEVKKRFKSKSFRFDLSNQKLLDHYILGSYKIGRHFTCGICGKAFRTRFNLKRHELTHADPELSECSICLKAVQDVERHMKRTHFSKHICDICGSKFATNGNLIKHMRIHSGDRPYICEMCGKKFRQKSILEIHIKSIHTGEKRHVCETCEKKFTTPAELRKHKMVHIPNKENKLCLTDIPEVINKLSYDDYTAYDTKIKLIMPEIDINTTTTFILCNQCSESLNNAYNFKCRCLEVEEMISNYLRETNTTVTNLKHVQTRKYKSKESGKMEPIKVEDYDQCADDVIADLNNFVDISLSYTQSPETFYNETSQDNKDVNSKKCADDQKKSLKTEVLNMRKMCNESIRTSKLRRYFKVQKYICDLCNKVFLYRSNFERHKLAHINGRKRFTCEICVKTFKNRYDLGQHEKTHSNETDNCTICAKSVRNIKKHMATTHFAKHVCEICGLKCASNGSLQEHMRTHTGDRPFKCEMCGKGFAQKGTLNVHIKSRHTGEKVHVCETCGKAFTTSAELRKHGLVHVTEFEKNFICDVESCGKAFRTKQGRRDHMKRHNPDKKYKCTICEKAFFDGQGIMPLHMLMFTPFISKTFITSSLITNEFPFAIGYMHQSMLPQ